MNYEYSESPNVLFFFSFLITNNFITLMRPIHLTLLLTILLVATQSQNAKWNSLEDIRTGRFQIVTIASFSIISLPVSYNITYTAPLTNTLSCGLGLVGFNTSLSNYFSLNVTITNFITTTMSVTAIALDDTVIIDLVINYIAVGIQIYFLDVQTVCFLPSVMNSKNGTRSQTRTGSTIFVNQPVSCNVMLTGFRIFNSVGLINTLSAQIDCSNTNGYTTTTFTATENNTVSLVCYTTIIFCDVCTKTNYFEWGRIGQNGLSPYIWPNTIIIKVTGGYPQYEDVDLTFWGLNELNFSRGYNRSFNFQTNYFQIAAANTTTIKQDYNYTCTTGCFNVTMAFFFIANRSCYDQSKGSNQDWFQVDPSGTLSCRNNNNCNNNTKQTLANSARYCAICHYSCLDCNGALATDCTSCSSTMYRNNVTTTCPCNSGYVDVNQTLCARCQDYIPGCNTCISTTICMTCFNGFYILAGTCQCTTGFLVTGVCTTIYGCISATNLAGTVYCLACNATIYYQLVPANHTCVCMSGYYVDINGNCIGKCGDAILAFGQQCDDGNIKDNDGCSSKCQIQANTTCINNPMPSNCVWNYNITASVAYIKRILDNNAVQIALKLDPPNSFYKSLDWSFNLYSDLPCVNGPDLKHNGDYLIIQCTYSQPLEGNTYNFTMQMDNFYYLNNSYLYATIPALGMNAKLTYDRNYGMNNFANILVIAISVYAVILMFLSTISERMIGVECIQTFQTVLYAMTVMQVSPSSIAPLQNLRYSTGYNNLYGTNNQRLYNIDFVIGEVGLQKQFLISFNLSYIILAIIIFALLFLKGIMLKFQSDKKKEEQQYNRAFSMQQIHPNYKNVKKAYKIIFERILFVAGFWCMFLVLFATVIQYTMQTSIGFLTPTKTNGFLSIIAVVVVLGFLTMVIINGLYPRLRIFPMFMDQKYPVYYTLYNLLYISLIIAFYKQDAIPFVLGGFTLLNLIILAIWRPYPENFHNAVIVFEQITIIIAIALYMYQNFTAPLENNESLFTIGFFAVCFLLLAVDVLSTIRLYKYWRYMKDHKLSYDEPQEADAESKEQEKVLVTPNSKYNDLGQTGKGKDDKANGNKIQKAGVSALFKPYEDSYYDGIRQNGKHPLNSQPQTKRFDQSRVESNQQDYETFSKKKPLRRDPPNNSFSINPIDPNAEEVSRNGIKPASPYDQYGNIKVHNKVNGQEEYDALKAIKARLRKDFYQKVHGTDIVPNQQRKAQNSLNNEPQNFEPSDQNEQD